MNRCTQCFKIVFNSEVVPDIGKALDQALYVNVLEEIIEVDEEDEEAISRNYNITLNILTGDEKKFKRKIHRFDN